MHMMRCLLMAGLMVTAGTADAKPDGRILPETRVVRVGPVLTLMGVAMAGTMLMLAVMTGHVPPLSRR